MLRDGSIPTSTDFTEVINLFDSIRASGTELPFEREDDSSWLARWIAVHDGIGDILLQLLTEKNEHLINFDNERDRIFSIIKYLFTVNDPIPEHEKGDYGDLFHIAINSVKGRAFQVLTQFVFYDGKKFDKSAEIKINNDVKILYSFLVETEQSLSTRFVIGHYLGQFYFRDKKWIEALLPNLFPIEAEKKNLYFASWEGYLNSTLYGDLFASLKSYYTRAIALPDTDYPDRKYTKSLDEALAIHIALAFSHFIDFDFNTELFQQFWSTSNNKRHKEFVSFIGRHCISRDDAWMEENKVDKEKLKAFWDWLLKRENTHPEVFSGFGFWVNSEKEVLNFAWLAERMAATMKKAKGLVEWDYGLMEQLPALAKVSPQHTLEIIEYYLLDGNTLNSHRSGWIHVDRELRETLEILYANSETRSDVYALIDKLIEIGGAQFWGLKSVVNDAVSKV